MDKENREYMEYFSALKKKEILTLVATWMYLEDFMLSKISQAEKGKYHMTSLYMDPKIVKLIVENRKLITRDWEWG